MAIQAPPVAAPIGHGRGQQTGTIGATRTEPKRMTSASVQQTRSSREIVSTKPENLLTKKGNFRILRSIFWTSFGFNIGEVEFYPVLP
jgi:hypothetical protein